MSKRLTIHRDEQPIYDIVIEQDFSKLTDELQRIELTGRKFCIVTDTTIAPLYLEELKSVILQKEGIVSFLTEYVIPAGEAYKTLDSVRGLYEHLILNHFERQDILLALGGGVVGDLTGYAAATYLRGIDFIQIPTTLLAQVDSSIGGKTGVDFDAYKNMVGAFYMPRLVYMNLKTLSTLEERVYLSGFGEIIKHAYIKNAAYLDQIIAAKDRILARDTDTLEQIIYESCKIKGMVVEHDPTEKGERMLLNFGHTLGHAIEKLSNFSLYHGECVVLGMIAAIAVSIQKGFLPEEALEQALSLFDFFRFPIQVDLKAEDIIRVSKSDKKMKDGKIRFTLLKEIGTAFIDYQVTDEDMEKALAFVIKES